MSGARAVAALGVAAWMALGAVIGQTQGRTLVVGSSATYPPFAYETPARQIAGFDVDVITAVAQKVGLTVRLVNTPFTGVFASLVNGDIDLIISGVTINEKRRQSYDFTAPYDRAAEGFLARLGHRPVGVGLCGAHRGRRLLTLLGAVSHDLGDVLDADAGARLPGAPAGAQVWARRYALAR